MTVTREVKHIRELSEMLSKMANEVDKKGKFSAEDKDLLKKVGSDLVFKGCVLEYEI